MDTLVGKTLSHYQILERLPGGGMGVVYRARDERLSRDVALKVLPSDVLADEAARRRFRKEALALSKLNNPNIATINDFGTQADVDFIVMEYIDGVNLDAMLRAGPLPEKEVGRLGINWRGGWRTPQKGVLQEDLKPGNLRLNPDGWLKPGLRAGRLSRARRGGSTSALILRDRGLLSQTAAGVLRGEGTCPKRRLFGGLSS